MEQERELKELVRNLVDSYMKYDLSAQLGNPLSGETITEVNNLMTFVKINY